MTHPHAFEQTQAMLDFAFDHLVLNCVGPRFLIGDWNFTISQLSVSAKLQQAGWVEVQDLFETRTGIPPRNTRKAIFSGSHQNWPDRFRRLSSTMSSLTIASRLKLH